MKISSVLRVECELPENSEVMALQAGSALGRNAINPNERFCLSPPRRCSGSFQFSSHSGAEQETLQHVIVIKDGKG
jgi:hypothetical protein